MKNETGVDVSHWVYPVDWQHWFEFGHTFSYFKATQGTQFADNKWKLHYEEANDFYRGAYHYFKADTNGEIQAQYFWNEIKNHKWAMKPVVDVERYYNLGVSKAIFAARVRNCLLELERLSGVRPMIYTSRSMWHQMIGSTSWASAYDLWVAHYTMYPIPLIPDDWKGKGYKMWQYVDRPVDQNRFDGGKEAFLEWIGVELPPNLPMVLKPGLYRVE